MKRSFTALTSLVLAITIVFGGGGTSIQVITKSKTLQANLHNLHYTTRDGVDKYYIAAPTIES